MVTSIPFTRCLCYNPELLLEFSLSLSLSLSLSHIHTRKVKIDMFDLIHYLTENGLRHARHARHASGPVQANIPSVTCIHLKITNNDARTNKQHELEKKVLTMHLN